MSEPAPIYTTRNNEQWRLGDGAISLIKSILPAGSSILEIGSGRGTGILSEHYIMTSIEHDVRFIGDHDSRYVYAPIVDDWYCERAIVGNISGNYDLLIIDGPPSGTHKDGRLLMNKYLHLFNLSAHIIIDDVNRPDCMALAEEIALLCKRPLLIFNEINDGRKYGYICSNLENPAG